LWMMPRVASVDLAAKLMRMARPQKLETMHRVVAEAMTTKETSFFRDLLPFHLLHDRLIPELIAAREKERRLYLWSAGSATGQEAYSLAMLLYDRFPQLDEWDVRIVGTDVSQAACESARRGRYSRFEINRGLPVSLLVRHFEREGEETWRIHEEVRRRVSFEQADLRDASRAGLMFDIVLLRNVLPYLVAEERVEVLRAVHSRMYAGSVTLLGEAEEAGSLFEEAVDRERVFYRPIVLG
jgi:chemotaxis protein methyltransferase CheR